MFERVTVTSKIVAEIKRPSDDTEESSKNAASDKKIMAGAKPRSTQAITDQNYEYKETNRKKENKSPDMIKCNILNLLFTTLLVQTSLNLIT